MQTAEQVVAALTGGVVSTAVNIPAGQRRRTWRCSGRSCRSAAALGRLAIGARRGLGVDRIEVEYLGRIAERDTRLLTLAVLIGVLAGHTEEDVNLVNAPSLAEERGHRGRPSAASRVARDFTDLVRVTLVAGGERVRVVGTDARAAAPPAPARGLGPALQPRRSTTAPRAVPLPRRARAWSAASAPRFGEHGVNISAAAVGPSGGGARTCGRRSRPTSAVMAIDRRRRLPSGRSARAVGGRGGGVASPALGHGAPELACGGIRASRPVSRIARGELSASRPRGRDVRADLEQRPAAESQHAPVPLATRGCSQPP